jgi:hypothetical protein
MLKYRPETIEKKQKEEVKKEEQKPKAQWTSDEISLLSIAGLFMFVCCLHVFLYFALFVCFVCSLMFLVSSVYLFVFCFFLLHCLFLFSFFALFVVWFCLFLFFLLFFLSFIFVFFSCSLSWWCERSLEIHCRLCWNKNGERNH